MPSCIRTFHIWPWSSGTSRAPGRSKWGLLREGSPIEVQGRRSAFKIGFLHGKGVQEREFIRKWRAQEGFRNFLKFGGRLKWPLPWEGLYQTSRNFRGYGASSTLLNHYILDNPYVRQYRRWIEVSLWRSFSFDPQYPNMWSFCPRLFCAPKKSVLILHPQFSWDFSKGFSSILYFVYWYTLCALFCILLYPVSYVLIRVLVQVPWFQCYSSLGCIFI